MAERRRKKERKAEIVKQKVQFERENLVLKETQRQEEPKEKDGGQDCDNKKKEYGQEG